MSDEDTTLTEIACARLIAALCAAKPDAVYWKRVVDDLGNSHFRIVSDGMRDDELADWVMPLNLAKTVLDHAKRR